MVLPELSSHGEMPARDSKPQVQLRRGNPVESGPDDAPISEDIEPSVDAEVVGVYHPWSADQRTELLRGSGETADKRYSSERVVGVNTETFSRVRVQAELLFRRTTDLRITRADQKFVEEPLRSGDADCFRVEIDEVRREQWPGWGRNQRTGSAKHAS